LEDYLRYYLQTGIDVIFVAGNHECYTNNPEERLNNLCKTLKTEFPNLHYLENKKVTLRGVVFGGATLWYPNQTDNIRYEAMMPDFQYIKVPGLHPRNWIYGCHEATREFLKTCDDLDVMVTHHMPSSKLIALKWLNSCLNRFFACDVLELLPKRPKLWVYGHTHERNNHSIFGTKFLINARGYTNELKDPFYLRTYEIKND